MKKKYFIFLIIALLAFPFIATAGIPTGIRKKMPEKKIKKTNQTTKSVTYIQHLLDSIYMYNENDQLIAKAHYKYDRFGNSTLEEEYEWDESVQKWIGEYKSSAGYNNQGNKILDITYDWDSEKNDWIIESKHEYEYNSQADMTAAYYYNLENGEEKLIRKSLYTHDYSTQEYGEESYYWNDNLKKLIGGYKNRIRLDNKGQALYEENYQWEDETETWKIYNKTEYQYDNEGNIIFQQQEHLNEATEEWWKNKMTYQYDSKGNMTYLENMSWDSSLKNWGSGSKQFWKYNNNNKLVQEDSYSWDGQKQKWIGDNMINYEYNSGGSLIKEVTAIWIENDWTEIYKTEHQYNASSKPELKSFYSKGESSWILSEKTTFEYDNEGICTETIHSGDEISGWKAYRKIRSDIDDTGNVYLYESYELEGDNDWVGTERYAMIQDVEKRTLLNERYIWDTAKKNWIGMHKDIYEYDNESNNTLYESYSDWNIDRQTWMNGQKYTYTIEEGKPLFYEKYEWIGEAQSWLLTHKSEQKFDNNGNEISSEGYDLDRSSNTWIGSHKYTSVYDEDSYEIESISYEWVKGKWIYDTRYVYEEKEYGTLYAEEYIWNHSTAAWEKIFHANFFYTETELETTINNEKEKDIYIYVSDNTLYIENIPNLTTASLYALNGTLVASTIESTLSLKNLQRGIYIVKVAYEGNTITQKIVIAH